ncbi:MAG: anhydro-N-acetylmuramic acid kinase [bacterium]|nr:anhydro-N-acetylmuramic acid kinase [bacterium]
MSGTSCDGVDAAVVRIEGTGPGLRAELLDFHTTPYPDPLRERLLAPDKSARDITLLNADVGNQLAQAAASAIERVRPKQVDVNFVASHGHTLAHYPPQGTFQIGEAAAIAERTGLPVVSDFRQRDMAAGGQGAPLVPYADWILFHRQDATVATLNIGGIANLTIVPPELDRVIAFDTGPGNMIIDGAAALLSNGTETMDTDGAGAARGTVSEPLLARLLDHPYFDRTPPKSTGREEFGPEMLLSPILREFGGVENDDVLATVTRLTAHTIADAVRRFVLPGGGISEIIASGGGAHNATLMRWIGEELPNIPIRLTDDYGIPSDARESMVFAILGNETLCGTPSNVPNATGARSAVVLGAITPP